MKKLLLILLVLTFFAAKAQNQKPYFNTLSIRSGLPEARIETTLEDTDGFIWMGTQNGLVRYDGYNLKPYPLLDADGLPLITPSVRNLHQDRDGKIWAFLREGLYYYKKSADSFIKLQIDLQIKEDQQFYPLPWVEDDLAPFVWISMITYPDLETPLYKFNTTDFSLQIYNAAQTGKTKLPFKDLQGVTKDSKGNIWIAGDDMLCYYDESSQSFKKHFELPEDLKGKRIFDPKADPTDADILWLTIDGSKDFLSSQGEFYGNGLIRFNKASKNFQIFKVNQNDSNGLKANCRNIVKDSLNRLWFLTGKGVSLFNAKQNNFINYDIDFPAGNGGASAIASDAIGNCWIGGDFQGLYYLNTKTGVSTLYKSDTKKGSLPLYDRISNLFFDRSGTLWVNMPYSGIAYLDKQKTVFGSQIVIPSGLPENAKSSETFKIVGTRGDSICYITDRSSLYAWQTKTNTFDKIDLKEDVYEGIRTVISTSDGVLWMGSRSDGLLQYNPTTRAVKHYKHNLDDTNSISGNSARALTIDADGIIWIGTDGSGMCSLNAQTETVTRYPYVEINDGKNSVSKTLNDPRIFDLFFDHENVLWICTNNGFISSFDDKTKEFTNYVDSKKGVFCATNIYEDSKQRLWIGSYLSGLYLFDRKTETFKNYNEQDGLLHNSVYEIEEDAAGNIWSVSERGLSRLDPETNTFTGFTQPVIDFNRYNHIYKDALQTFRLTGSEGIIHFNPADLEANPVAPSVIIESIAYSPSENSKDENKFLYPEAGKDVNLRYDENKIGFQFVGLHFENAAKNQYAYQLVGYDKDWIPSGTTRTATYTNLSPGTYEFMVKAANSDGVWSTENPSVTLIISPPWWLTWWAYVLYAIIFIIALSSFIAYRSARLKRENKLLEEKVLHRTNQLTKSIDDLKNTQSQLIQSEKMASLGELTAGIAHEIQNPLNFVNNFSELNKELIEEMQVELQKGEYSEVLILSKDIKENQEKITHHGKRADAIVKGMLQHSRSSSNEKIMTDINALADEYMRLAYHGLRAKDKSFNATLDSDFDGSIKRVNMVPQDIGRVLLNLFTNAFYACADRSRSAAPLPPQTGGGFKDSDYIHNPTVKVSTKKTKHGILISVSDNGPGIPKHVLDKIFQPFFTTKPSGEGTGLGLSMSYDIIKAHGGELKVETELNIGTTFTILLPI